MLAMFCGNVFFIYLLVAVKEKILLCSCALFVMRFSHANVFDITKLFWQFS